jgi:hypothetical protein
MIDTSNVLLYVIEQFDGARVCRLAAK